MRAWNGEARYQRRPHRHRWKAEQGFPHSVLWCILDMLFYHHKCQTVEIFKIAWFSDSRERNFSREVTEPVSEIALSVMNLKVMTSTCVAVVDPWKAWMMDALFGRSIWSPSEVSLFLWGGHLIRLILSRQSSMNKRKLVVKQICVVCWIATSIQRTAKRLVRGCEKFVPALAYLFCLALPGSCLARFAYLLANFCT